MSDIKEFSKTDAALAGLKAQYEIVPDMSTPEGYEAGRLAIADLRTWRTSLDKFRLDLNRDDQAMIKYRNDEARRITAKLVKLEEPLKAAKQAIDDEAKRIKLEAAQAEAARIGKIESTITSIRQAVNCPQTVQDLNDQIARVQHADPDGEYFGEFSEAAHLAINQTLETLGGYLESAAAAETEAERVRIESEQLARDLAELAAEKQKLADERAEIQAAQDEIDKEKQIARDLAEEAERLEREKAEEIEAEKAEELRKADQLAEMIADKQRFNHDAKVLLRIAYDLDQVNIFSQAQDAGMSTTEGTEFLEIIGQDVEALTERILASSVVRSQDEIQEAA